MRKISRSLTAKLILGVTLVATTIYVVTAGTLFLQSRRMIRQEANEHAHSVLNTALQQVGNCMRVVETATNANAGVAEENFYPDSLMRLARRIVYLNRNSHGCTIAAKPDAFADKGQFYSVYAIYQGDSLIMMREPEYDYTVEDWYKVPVATGKGCWSRLYTKDTKGVIDDYDHTLAIYSKPICKDGMVVGVVSTGLSFRKLAQAIYDVQYPYPNAYFVIRGGDGQYLLPPDSIHMDVAGKYHQMCSMSIPDTDWSLALVCPSDDVLKNYHQMVLYVVLFDVLAVILIVLLCRWGVHRALWPIWNLVGMSKQIAKGRYDEIIPPTKRQDALGRMQNSFAIMQRSIRRHIYSIHATTDEITRHNKEVEFATKMAQEAQERKTLFVQNVMHQIRTPLNIIQGFAQVLRDELKSGGLGNEEFANIATMMKHNSQHLSRMVLMLYDSSEAGLTEEYHIDRKDQVSCNDVVRECIKYSKEHFPDIPVEFRTELFDSTMILTNRLYLMRTLRELLYNAAKYSDGQHIKVIVSQTTTSVLFTVEDTGPGLPQEQQDMIYEFFAKQNDLSEGLGLGLPLSKRHAICLGGNLRYDKNYKEGCRFVVTMPK